MNTIGCMSRIDEKFRYAPHMLTEREIYDALKELEDWRAMATNVARCDDAAELKDYIEELEGNQENEDHANYDDLKSFFDDCVEALNARWPAAEPYDMNLRDVILSAISRGDVEDEE